MSKKLFKIFNIGNNFTLLDGMFLKLCINVPLDSLVKFSQFSPFSLRIHTASLVLFIILMFFYVLMVF